MLNKLGWKRGGQAGDGFLNNFFPFPRKKMGHVNFEHPPNLPDFFWIWEHKTIATISVCITKIYLPNLSSEFNSWLLWLFFIVWSVSIQSECDLRRSFCLLLLSFWWKCTKLLHSLLHGLFIIAFPHVMHTYWKDICAEINIIENKVQCTICDFSFCFTFFHPADLSLWFFE